MNFKPTRWKVIVCVLFVLFFMMSIYQTTSNKNSEKTLKEMGELQGIFPNSITNLRVMSKTNDSIYWVWDNPTAESFYENRIYINGRSFPNTKNNFYNATELMNDTTYTIKVESVDSSGKQINIRGNRLSVLWLTFPFWLSSFFLIYLIWSLFQKGKKIDTLLDDTKIDMPHVEKIEKKRVAKKANKKKLRKK